MPNMIHVTSKDVAVHILKAYGGLKF